MMHLNDFSVGQVFETPTVEVTSDDIKEFARQYDPQPFHLDEQAARESVFGQLVASGWHTAALTMRLWVDHGPQISGGLVGLGVDELRWGPLRPGDHIRLHARVLEVRPSRSGAPQGVVRFRVRTLNQREEEVQHMVPALLVPTA